MIDTVLIIASVIADLLACAHDALDTLLAINERNKERIVGSEIGDEEEQPV